MTRLAAIALSLSVALVGALTGCGESDDEASTPNTDEVAEGYVPSGGKSFSSPGAAAAFAEKNSSAAKPKPLLTAPQLELSPGAPPPEGDPSGVSGTASEPSGRGVEVPGGRPSGLATDTPKIPFKREEWTGSPQRPPASVEAKITYKDHGVPYKCSGTVVNSPNRSVVWTAGHCVYFGDDPGTPEHEDPAYSTDIAVAPGYHDKQAPFGWWPARAWNTTQGWQDGWEDPNASVPEQAAYDLGVIVLDKVAGKTVQEAIAGAQGISFNSSGDPPIDSFGYPGRSPFDGESLIYCASKVGAWMRKENVPPLVGIGCDMNEGSSGGGWIREFDPQAGWGRVYSVNSLGRRDAPLMFGPYQGTAAANLYEWAKNR